MVKITIFILKKVESANLKHLRSLFLWCFKICSIFFTLNLISKNSAFSITNHSVYYVKLNSLMNLTINYLCVHMTYFFNLKLDVDSKQSFLKIMNMLKQFLLNSVNNLIICIIYYPIKNAILNIFYEIKQKYV